MWQHSPTMTGGWQVLEGQLLCTQVFNNSRKSDILRDKSFILNTYVVDDSITEEQIKDSKKIML